MVKVDISFEPQLHSTQSSKCLVSWFNQCPEISIQINGRDKSQRTYKLSGEDIDLDHPNLECLKYLYVPSLGTICSPEPHHHKNIRRSLDTDLWRESICSRCWRLGTTHTWSAEWPAYECTSGLAASTHCEFGKDTYRAVSHGEHQTHLNFHSVVPQWLSEVNIEAERDRMRSRIGCSGNHGSTRKS
jgi:hypothetical protein